MTRTGLERLVSQRQSLVQQRRIGILCHAASVDSQQRHIVDLLPACGAKVRALFGPEHGIRGAAQDMVGVGHGRDQRLGVPIHSLYGDTEDTLAVRAGWLQGLDAMVIDLQDVGSRYYTYVWSAAMMLERCAEVGLSVIVLDRPNPLGGVRVEGPAVGAEFRSFVGYHDVPVRHGLTLGEMMRLVRRERNLEVDLTVVAMEGWDAREDFAATRLPWILPSPNMPTLDTARVYPGGCLFEGTELSEGRGTTRPFEIFGAPHVDGHRLAEALRADGLGGVAWRELVFEPAFHKHAGERCGGLQLHVTDEQSYCPLLVGVAILRQLRRLWPEEFAWREKPYEFVIDKPAIDLLAGDSTLREGLEQGADLTELCQTWEANEREFAQRAAEHLLYPRSVS